MPKCSIERLISHAIRRLRQAERKVARDASAADEVEFWEAQVVRFIERLESMTDPDANA